MSKPQVSHKLKEQLRKIVEQEGATFIEVEMRQKHPRIHMEYQGRRLRAVVSATPSDHRAFLNIKTQIRHILRESTDGKAQATR